MEKEKQRRLERAMLPYNMRDIEVAVNLYIWLVYNDFTPEDLRENLDYLRNTKRRDILNGITFDGSADYKDFPYSLMKALQKTFRRILRGEVTIADLQKIYKEERERVLSLESFGRRRCIPCERKRQEWPMEVLR